MQALQDGPPVSGSSVVASISTSGVKYVVSARVSKPAVYRWPLTTQTLAP